MPSCWACWRSWRQQYWFAAARRARKRNRHRLLSSSGGPSHASCGRASSVKGDWSRSEKAKGLRSSERTWETGSSGRSGKGLHRGRNAAQARRGQGWNSGIQGAVREPGPGQKRAASGTDARYSAADEVGQSSSISLLTTNTPGSSGGIDSGSLSRNVGGGGGRGGGGGGMGGARCGGGWPARKVRSRGSEAATGLRLTAAWGLPAPMKKYRLCSTVTSRLSTGTTTGNSAAIRLCRARWCFA